MRHVPALCAALGLALTGCSTTVVGTATPAPTAPDDLAPMVEELYAGMSSASRDGFPELVDYVLAHNHPLFAYTADECALGLIEAYGAFEEGTAVNAIPYVDDLVPDDTWVPGGRYAGEVPEGDIYALTVATVVQNGDTAVSTQGPAHVAVLDGAVWFFQRCQA